MAQRVQVSEDTRTLVEKCWFIDGNAYDGYKVINGKGEVIASTDNTVSVRDMASIRLIVASHNAEMVSK